MVWVSLADLGGDHDGQAAQVAEAYKSLLLTILPDTLWLQILSPQDEAVVNIPQVDVMGSAPAGTVITINDDILIVGNDQQFKTTISLDEGPNLIEIIASDDNGNEMPILLTITYEP